MNTLPRTLLAAALVLGSQHLLANTSEKLEGWYQIHLAVFANRTGAGEYDEVWRNQLQLRYPKGLTRLKTRQRYLADLCSPPDEHIGSSENRLVDILERVDAGEGYPEDYREPEARDTPRPLDPACKELYPDRFPPSAEEQAKAREQAALESARSVLSDPDAAGTAHQNGPVKPPLPFILSENLSDAEFAEMVKKIRGAHRYRLLFSGSWPQRLNPRDSATPVLIQGGDPVGKHYELEGYVKIALERYLHIDTDLWLSDFGRGAAILRHTEGYTPTAEEAQAARRSEFPALPTPFPVNDPGFRPEQADALSEGSEGETEQRPASNLDILMAEDSSYYVERTVVMRQNRRMRSDEVHYLDHPMFGLLIKITPIAAPADNKTAMR